MEIWRWRQLYHLSVRWPSLSLFHKRGNRRPALSAAGRGPAAGYGAAGRLLPAGQGSPRLSRRTRQGRVPAGKWPYCLPFGPGAQPDSVPHASKGRILFFQSSSQAGLLRPGERARTEYTFMHSETMCWAGAANAGAAFYRSTRFSRPPRRLNISFEIVPACSARSQAVSSWSPDRPMRVAASPGETDGISVTSTKV